MATINLYSIFTSCILYGILIAASSCFCDAFFSSTTVMKVSSNTRLASPSPPTTRLFYQNEKTKSAIKIVKGKKAIITQIKNLDDLRYFLEEDDRPVAIK